MQADLQDFINKIGQLPDVILSSYETAALAAFTMVQHRIQEQGLSHDGKTLDSIRPYSKKYLDFKKNPPPGAGMKNRYRGFVDFTLTGRMWANIQQLNSGVNPQGVKVVMGAQSSDNQQKVEHLSLLWEDIFLMGGQEIQLTGEVLDEDLQRRVDQLFA